MPAQRKRGTGAAKRPLRATKKKSRSTSKRAGAEKRANAALVERTVELIVEHERGSAGSLRRIGEMVLAEYFGGDLALAKSRAPAKPKSYALLAERAAEEAGWDERDVRRAVTVAAAAKGLPATIAEKLTASHLLGLAAIDDPAIRADAARQIAGGEVTGDDAKVMLAKLSAAERHGGRPRLPGPVRATGQLERALERAEDAGDLTAAETRAVDDADRPALADRLEQVAEKLRRLAQRLRD